MGQCYRCANQQCTGGRSQFDWITPVVVELALSTGRTIYVDGYYDGHGRVICRVGKEHQVKVYDKQFSDFFRHWGGHDHEAPPQLLSRKIFCNGHGYQGGRFCVPAGARVYKAIPERSYANVERLPVADGGAVGDVREPYSEEEAAANADGAMAGLMLEQVSSLF
mmetsp:Transcript_31329/g.96965  ORF Transcript_31329/g.96965 Transcript_31329/m.96965 type:complete len:165 (+) Transcript_31329:401-895(+)